MKKTFIILGMGLLVMGSCKKMDFDDPTTFTVDEAQAITPDFYFKNAMGAWDRVFNYTTDGYRSGFALNCLADQTSTTNRVQEWWDYTNEPRRRLNMSQSYSGASNFTRYYNNFYLANLDATRVIQGLDAGEPGIDENGNDRKNDIYAVAYLSKAIAQGYLGAIYDRGVIVDEIPDASAVPSFPNSYKELIENSMTYFDNAIAAATASTSASFDDFHINITLTKAQFIQFANSMAARVLASIPRDKAEAAALGSAHWNRVLQYANKGLTANFTTTYVSGGYYNDLVDYAIYALGDGAGYLPADIKIPYLADKTGTYPNSYPLSQSVILDPVQTDDARFEDYFAYSKAFGYLREDRGRNHFSNYRHQRWDNADNWLGVPGAISPVFLAEEVRLIKAEAMMWLGDFNGAAALLNDASADRKALGGLPDIAATEAAVRKALHYEYAISIDCAGTVINPWVFMRRNDLLQGGTATEYPIYEQQLLLAGLTPYSFGGKDYFGEKGSWGETATAANVGWKPSN